MYNNVYVLSVHNTKVSLGLDWLRSSKKDIRELSSAHGTAPSIGKTITKCLTDQSLWFGCVTHMSHMKCTGNLAVDCSWLDLSFMPQILCMLRSSLQPSGISSDLSVLFLSKIRHFMSQIIDVFALCLNTPLFCNTDQLLRIFYLVIAALFCMSKCDTDLTSVIRVCSCAACCKTKEVSSYDTMYIASADTSRCLRCNTARTHSTDSATYALLTEFTVWSLILNTHLPGISAYLCTSLKKTGCGSFEFFHCS